MQRKFGDIYLFKFIDELQSQFEELLQKKKAYALTPEEESGKLPRRRAMPTATRSAIAYSICKVVLLRAIAS